jgi:hypothetical protein
MADCKPPDWRKKHVTVEATEAGMVFRLPDFKAVQMEETAEARVTIKPHDGPTYECRHAFTGTYVKREQRTVHCRKCDAQLDPFTVLLEIAQDHDRVRNDFTRGRQETIETQTRLEVLKRLERNARERLKRLGVKHVETWWQRNLTDVLKEIIRQVQREALEAAKNQGVSDG